MQAYDHIMSGLPKLHSVKYIAKSENFKRWCIITAVLLTSYFSYQDLMANGVRQIVPYKHSKCKYRILCNTLQKVKLTVRNVTSPYSGTS